jgi:cell division protein FtsL
LTHDPVLLEEALLFLRPERGGIYVDCTLGLGGHTEALVARGATRVIGIDRDAEALASATARLAPVAGRVELVHADYRTLPAVLSERGITAVDGILADLGVSSLQFDSDGRGFSFRRDEPLDMRMDRSRGPTAADLVNAARETELADVIFRYGEDRQSRRIARAIVASRPVTTTGELAAIVRRAHRSSDAHVPGPPDLGQRGARGSRYVREDRGSASRPGGEALRDLVPLARGPHRQAHDARPERGGPGAADSDEEADGAGRGGDPAQSAVAQREAARDRTAGRLTRDAMEAFEYAIKKDVRNNPIVREVDEARMREMLRSTLVGAFVVAIVLYSAWQHFELVRYGYRIEQMQQQRAAEETVNRHLKLNIQTLSRPDRIEELASRRLKLVQPAAEDTFILERVIPSEPPARSVVAAR